jgi:hypothetical protein
VSVYRTTSFSVCSRRRTKCRSFTPAFGSTTKLQHIHSTLFFWPKASLAAQQNDFDNACSTFSGAFRATPPYDELSPAINIFRVNVTSTDSGADDPAAAGGTGASVRTYFDASFGGNNIRRLLICNNTTALQVAAAQIPEFTAGLVVVNSTIYGGSGGSIGTYSLAGGPGSQFRWIFPEQPRGAPRPQGSRIDSFRLRRRYRGAIRGPLIGLGSAVRRKDL